MENDRTVCETKNCIGVPVKYRYEAVSYCVECSQNLCSDCVRTHKRASKTRRHTLGDVRHAQRLPVVEKSAISSSTMKDESPLLVESTSSISEVDSFSAIKIEPKDENCSELTIQSTSQITMAKDSIDDDFSPVTCPQPGVRRLGRSTVRNGLFKCTECWFTSNYRKCLNRHVQRYHGDNRPFKCSQCPLSFGDSDSLMSHASTHQQHSCLLCSYSAQHANELSKHRRDEHAETYSFQCDDCDYLTDVKRSLTKHMSSCKKRSTVSHVCDQCSFVAQSRVKLQEHRNTHQVLRCPHCAFITTNKYTYSRHVNRHGKDNRSGGRNVNYTTQRWIQHQCGVCDFEPCDNEKPVLDHFWKEHVDHVSFTCHLCKYVLSVKVLNAHMRTHIRRIWLRIGDAGEKVAENTRVLLSTNVAIKIEHVESP